MDFDWKVIGRRLLKNEQVITDIDREKKSVSNVVSAEKINLFTATLMKHFGIQIQDYVFKLCTVCNGCVELVYSMPLCIYKELFPLNEDQCKSLPMLGVMEVITKDYHYKKDDVSDTYGYVMMYRCMSCVCDVYLYL